MPELDTPQGDAEIGRCHICGLTFTTQEDLAKHVMEAHGSKEAVAGS